MAISAGTYEIKADGTLDYVNLRAWFLDIAGGGLTGDMEVIIYGRITETVNYDISAFNFNGHKVVIRGATKPLGFDFAGTPEIYNLNTSFKFKFSPVNGGDLDRDLELYDLILDGVVIEVNSAVANNQNPTFSVHDCLISNEHGHDTGGATVFLTYSNGANPFTFTFYNNVIADCDSDKAMIINGTPEQSIIVENNTIVIDPIFFETSSDGIWMVAGSAQIIRNNCVCVGMWVLPPGFSFGILPALSTYFTDNGNAANDTYGNTGLTNIDPYAEFQNTYPYGHYLDVFHLVDKGIFDADFSGTPTFGNKPLSVAFTNLSVMEYTAGVVCGRNGVVPTYATVDRLGRTRGIGGDYSIGAYEAQFT